MKNGKIDKYFYGGGYAQASVVSATTDNFAFYFYNQDHLGNIREVVDASGAVKQVNNYYPFGAPYADTSAATSPDFQPYKYNGKELDKMHGLNTFDYGARQYDPILARWDRNDPLCEKYYDISPYAYCASNPIRFIDSDGREILLNKNCSKEFSNQYYAAVAYLKEHDAAQVWEQLNSREETIIISENTKKSNYTYGNEVFWNPFSGLYASAGSEGHRLSPAIRLIHELGHKLQELTGEYDTACDGTVWQSKEELRNILEVETPAAIACGEIPENAISRDSHSETAFITDSSTSTKIMNPEDPDVQMMIMCWE